MAKAIAREMGYRYIDSGAMYRGITYFVQQHGISLEELQSMSPDQMNAMLDQIHLSFGIDPETGNSELYLNGINIEKKIRDLKVSDWVSPVSAIPAIRHRMVALQQHYGRLKGIVMDGRDIGTKVFPFAELKIFMTARNEVRAKRRFDELSTNGFMVTMDEVIDNIEKRDFTDTHRAESPLRQADDAIVLDNTNLNEQEQFDFAMNLIRSLVEA